MVASGSAVSSRLGPFCLCGTRFVEAVVERPFGDGVASQRVGSAVKVMHGMVRQLGLRIGGARSGRRVEFGRAEIAHAVLWCGRHAAVSQVRSVRGLRGPVRLSAAVTASLRRASSATRVLAASVWFVGVRPGPARQSGSVADRRVQAELAVESFGRRGRDRFVVESWHVEGAAVMFRSVQAGLVLVVPVGARQARLV
jgi:hypothetical protein